jgi:Natural resistance-associated macrophage protein
MNPPKEKWFAIIGPGAIIASLTIGAGELVFSSRGGALFGYDLLKFFMLICFIKWALVLLTGRQMVLTGKHPVHRWCELPGPRGWLVWVFILLGVLAFPIWIGFHAATLGTLAVHLLVQCGLPLRTFGGSHIVCGLILLSAVMVLVQTGGYERLERLQIGIVLLMLIGVMASLLMLGPDWLAIGKSLISLDALKYPDWVDKYPTVAQRPLWMELAAYVGVLGGSGYDYLAYVSYLRDKGWGAAQTSEFSAQPIARQPVDSPTMQRHLWYVFVDSTVSFAIVFVFAAVFVVCGTVVLQPAQQLPEGSDLLTLQARFVEAGSAWLRPLYFAGTFLAMLGTLYGTIEVAPAVARELLLALNYTALHQSKLHQRVTTAAGLGGGLVLIWILLAITVSEVERPPALIAMLDPANLFTGVLACGWISGLAVWTEYKFVPVQHRAPWWLLIVNSASCCLFAALGIKAYWDYGGTSALLILLGTVAVGWISANLYQRIRG